MPRMQGPPPVLDGYRVLAFASIKLPIRFSGNSGLIIIPATGSAVEVGPVPRLAIGEPLRGERELALMHCTRAWNVIGVQSGFRSVSDAKDRAARIYPGISRAWVKTRVSKRDARRYEREIWKELTCSFCGRIPPESKDTDARVSSPSANICGACVRRFQEQLATQ